MRFYNSIQSEVLKVKGSGIPIITILGSLFLSLIFTARYIYISTHINLSNSAEPWERLFSQNARPFLGFIIPIGVMLICTLITQIEYSNNNWKQVHTTPQYFTTIFFAKFSILLGLSVMVFCLLVVGVLIHGFLPTLILTGDYPTAPIPTIFFFSESLKCFVLSLPIIGFQYLLSFYFRNFMIPFGIGLMVYVGSMPGVRLGDISYISPYSFVLKYFDQLITPVHSWLALSYFMVLMLVSYFLYIHKSEKG